MNGTVGILNVGAGDVELSFDPANASERIRAARIVRDMLRRGYAILVEIEAPDGEKSYTRALDFDEKHCRYIIADFDPLAAHESDMDEAAIRLRSAQEIDEDLRAAKRRQEEREYGEREQTESEASSESTGEVKRKRGRPRKSVDASKVRAVAVGRSAGG